jgi:predicted glycoside hydrolase/deacetylase ChbG (UPF0249 family)
MKILAIIFLSLLITNCTSQTEDLASQLKKPLNMQLGYKPSDILVIVHADDIAMHKDQTDASLKAMDYGMCKTGSVMVPCPDFNRTVKLYKKSPNLDLGIHLTLTSEWENSFTWKPLLSRKKVPSLYNAKGVMWKDEKALMLNMNIDQALMEVEKQIQTALAAGIKLTHIDAHMGCYFLDYELMQKIPALAKKYQLPFLMGGQFSQKLKPEGFVFPDSITCIYKLHGETYDHQLRKKAYHKWLKNLKPGVHELLVHIADTNNNFGKLIVNPQIRANDFKIWTSAETKRYAEKRGIKFIGYRKLYDLQIKYWQLLEKKD